MNSSPRDENKGELWFQTLEVHEFNDEDKSEVLSTLQTMAKALLSRNEQIGQQYAYIISQLQIMPAKKVQDYLITYLSPSKLSSIINVKSFIYLKRSAENPMEENRLLEKKLAEKVVMDFLHIVFYKTIPCAQGNHCKHYPRKIVHKNDFLDIELDCYYYHHEKDRRRFVIKDSEKEFRYAGNFADNKKVTEKTGFSQNFFESLFHPLYYKNFKCVRTKCGESIFCPYFHSEEEKTIWAVFFRGYFGKDREVFTKKKNSDEENFQRMRMKKISGLGKGTFMKGIAMSK